MNIPYIDLTYYVPRPEQTKPYMIWIRALLGLNVRQKRITESEEESDIIYWTKGLRLTAQLCRKATVLSFTLWQISWLAFCRLDIVRNVLGVMRTHILANVRI